MVWWCDLNAGVWGRQGPGDECERGPDMVALLYKLPTTDTHWRQWYHASPA
jgi:hypothetical protein